MEARTRQTHRVRPWISICSFWVERLYMVWQELVHQEEALWAMVEAQRLVAAQAGVPRLCWGTGCETQAAYGWSMVDGSRRAAWSWFFIWLLLTEKTAKNTFTESNYHFTVFGCQIHYGKINLLWTFFCFYILFEEEVKIFFLHTSLFLNNF